MKPIEWNQWNDLLILLNEKLIRCEQLGLGDNIDRKVFTKIPNIKAKFISAGRYHSLIIDQENNVYSFGYNGYGQLGLGDNINRNKPEKISNIKAKAISAGEGYSLIIC